MNCVEMNVLSFQEIIILSVYTWESFQSPIALLIHNFFVVIIEIILFSIRYRIKQLNIHIVYKWKYNEFELFILNKYLFICWISWNETAKYFSVQKCYSKIDKTQFQCRMFYIFVEENRRK